MITQTIIANSCVNGQGCKMVAKLLDCSLRDGGYVNKFLFGKNAIRDIIRCLSNSRIDIVELGFLQNGCFSEDQSLFETIEEVYEYLSDEFDFKPEYTLMARIDRYSINKLSRCNGIINTIRSAFYFNFLEKALTFGEKVIQKGYNCIFNVVNTTSLTESELYNLVNRINQFMPYGLTIVDTFGSMLETDLERICKILVDELHPDIYLGLHLHDNMTMAFGLAQKFIKYCSSQRNIIVDSSLMGIGRAPGNLCSEVIVDYMNRNYHTNYNIRNIHTLIDNYILPIKNNYIWGYSPAYYISAAYRVHRSYSEYLVEQGMPLVEIETLISKISDENRNNFNQKYIESLCHAAKNGKL